MCVVFLLFIGGFGSEKLVRFLIGKKKKNYKIDKFNMWNGLVIYIYFILFLGFYIKYKDISVFNIIVNWKC